MLVSWRCRLRLRNTAASRTAARSGARARAASAAASAADSASGLSRCGCVAAMLLFREGPLDDAPKMLAKLPPLLEGVRGCRECCTVVSDS